MMRGAEMMFFHAVQQGTPRQSEERGGVCAVAAVQIQRELDQRALNGDEGDAARRNRDACVGAGIRPANRDRCMLGDSSPEGHAVGKASTMPRSARAIAPLSGEKLAAPLSRLFDFAHCRRDCLKTDSADKNG